MPAPYTRSETISPLTTRVEIDRSALARLRASAAMSFFEHRDSLIQESV